MYFHLHDFNLKNFKDEIISLFKNNDPLYKYDFQLNSVYYIHLFLPSGEIIGNLPFKLLSIDDNEDLIEDFYLDLLPDMDIYLRGLEVLEDIEYPYYIGLYINIKPEDKINPEDLLQYKDKCLSDEHRFFKKEYINRITKIPLYLLPHMTFNKKG
jgi:hypothetical protein